MNRPAGPSIIVPGDPIPMPRQSYRIVGLPPIGQVLTRKPFVQNYVPKKGPARGVQKAIRQTWRDAGHGCYQPDVYLCLWALFYFPRPKKHLRANGDVLPRFIRTRPASRGASRGGRRYGGDVDNLLKLVLDALNEVAYVDDAQVVRLEAEKRYVDQGSAPAPQTVIGIDVVDAPMEATA